MKKLSTQSFLFGTLFVIIALLLIDVISWTRTRSFLLEEVHRDLQKKLSLSKILIDVDAFERKDLTRLKAFADEIKQSTELRTTFIDKTGRVLADSEIDIAGLKRVENHLGRKEVQQALRSGSGLAHRTSNTIHKKLIYYCETLKNNGRVIGFVRLSMFSPAFNEKLKFLASMFAILNVIALVVFVTGFLLYSRLLNSCFSSFHRSLSVQKDTAKFTPLPKHPFEEFNYLRLDMNAVCANLQNQNKTLITQKRQAQDILNTLSEGLGAFDNAGLPLLYNKAFVDILNLEKEQIADKPFYDWLHFPPLIQDIEKFSRKCKEVKRRIRYYHDKYIEYHILPLANGEVFPGFLVCVNNVTDLQHLETVRQDFVDNVSHEFKTPLTSILGYTETLLSGSVTDANAQQKFLKKIDEQTRQLEKIVSDLLQLSKIEHHAVQKIKKINPISSIKSTFRELVPLARDQKISMKLDIPSAKEKVKIRGNKSLFQSLIRNLLSNAIYYNRPDGKVWLRASHDEHKIRIEVKDTGIGIPKSEQKRIFERFYRIDKSRSRNVGGTGLGLSIVKHITEAFGGTLGVESQSGEGSTFWLEFPVEKST
jgi:two-component system phosphate regulon sensor histidine kinase PhoR